MMVVVTDAHAERSLGDMVANWWAHTSTPMLMCDAAGIIVGGNDALTTLIDGGAGALAGTELLALLGERDRSWVRSYVDRLIDGDLDHVDAQVLLGSGERSPIECLVRIEAFDADDRRHLVMLVRELDVEQNVDFEHRLRQLLAHIEDEITLIDRNGRIVSTSGQFRTTLSYPHEFWQERTVLDILAPEEHERVMTAFADLMDRPGDSISGEFAVVASDGSRATLEADAVNLLDEPGIHAVVLTTRNINDRLRTMDALRVSRDTALEAVERLDHVVATIGHELRNPLHAVRGIAELLATARLEQRERELATTLVTELDHLSKVTANLLDSAGTSGTQIELRPTDVRSLLHEVVTLTEADVQPGVEVRESIADSVPRWLQTDEVRLHQILANLTRNAAKYTSEGSISISCTRAGDHLVFDVEDTGRGVEPVDLGRIFEKFLVGSNAGAQGGAGLGLSIVKHLAQLLDGSVEAHSTVGEGSRFTVRIPLVEPAEPPADLFASDTGTSTSQGLVLVVEDSALNQQLAAAQLDVLGYGSATFTSGEAIIEIARAGLDPAVVAVLMDYQLEGIDGAQTTEELRALGVKVPIIGFTANATAARQQTLHDAGMDDVLIKPVGLNDLGTALRRAIGSRLSGKHGDDAPHHGDHLAIVDPTILDTLVDELGDVAPVRTLVSTFLDEMNNRWAATTSDDPQKRRRQAHTLKSTARLVGATALAEACERIERDEPADDDRQIADRTAEQLTAWLSAHDTSTTAATEAMS